MAEKITLVGGGLAGSLMSIYLAKRGYDVHVFERRADMRGGKYEGGRSINLALSTRGINALSRVGLVDDILKIAIPMKGRQMHDRVGNLNYQPYGHADQAIYSVSRGELNIRLLQLADEFPNIHMQFETRCTHCNFQTGETRYIDSDGFEFTDKADIVLATDGAFSAVRDAMMRTSGFNYSQSYESHGYKELEIVPGVNGEFQMVEEALHIWPRASFMMIALPNPGGNFTCTLFMDEQTIQSLDSPEKVMALFEAEFPDAIPMMPNLVDDFFQNPTGSLVTMRCYPWVKGKAALMGDSAHAVVPFYGQGMNCSFEDCVVLDDCLEAFGGDWGQSLAEYQEKRKPNADAIASLAIQNFIEMRDLVGQPSFLHKKKIEHALSERYPDTFKSQYERVTFSNEDYAEALRMGSINDALLTHIIQEGLENELDNEPKMRSLMAEFLV
jgi:kynurenine 3-monooxygenase